MTRSLLLLALIALTACDAANAQPPARIDCEIRENGKPGSGTMRVLEGDREVAKGACGKPVEVAPGSYDVRVVLDGALDAPEHRETVQAKAGAASKVRAGFETGELVVDVTRGGKRGLGTVKVVRAGTVVATMSAGVASRLSTGTYRIEVDSRGETRAFDAVSIAVGERRAIAVDFASQASP